MDDKSCGPTANYEDSQDNSSNGWSLPPGLNAGVKKLKAATMKYWFFETVLLVMFSLSLSGCCCFPCLQPWPHVMGEPACGIEQQCFEPDCGPPVCEPDCGIASCGSGCGIVEPDCGCVGPPHPCGWGRGCCGPFGIWTGWGPDLEAAAAGWKHCPGPVEWLRSALCCGGCGACYWDEWACDPPRCCDPCGLVCGNYGCQGNCACGAACGGVPCASGVCNSSPARNGSGYAKELHRWPPKQNAAPVAGAQRRVVRQTAAATNCDCEQCRRERMMMAQRRRHTQVHRASYEN